MFFYLTVNHHSDRFGYVQPPILICCLELLNLLTFLLQVLKTWKEGGFELLFIGYSLFMSTRKSLFLS